MMDTPASIFIQSLLKAGVTAEVINSAKDDVAKYVEELFARKGGNDWTGTYLILTVDSIYGSGLSPADFVDRGWRFVLEKNCLTKSMGDGYGWFGQSRPKNTVKEVPELSQNTDKEG